MRYSDLNTTTPEEDLPLLISHKAGHSPLPESLPDKKVTKKSPKSPKILLFLAVLAAAGYFIYGKHQFLTAPQTEAISTVTPAPVNTQQLIPQQTFTNESATASNPAPSPSATPESSPALLIRPQTPGEPASTPEIPKPQVEVAQLYHGKSNSESSPSFANPSSTSLPNPIPTSQTALQSASSPAPLPASSPTPSPVVTTSLPLGKSTFPGLTATNDTASTTSAVATTVPTPTPGSSPAATPPVNGSIITQNYEETSLNMQQVDVALFPKSTELSPQTLHLNVPIIHEKRLLSFTANDIAQFNNLVTRIQDTRSKQIALQKEMQAELTEYNTLIQKGTPEAVLNADSPSLISNTNSQGAP